MIKLIMTKMTKMISIIVETMKFTIVIGYHKPQFDSNRSARIMLVNGLCY